MNQFPKDTAFMAVANVPRTAYTVRHARVRYSYQAAGREPDRLHRAAVSYTHLTLPTIYSV